ncbi:MAG: phytoene/squalene synthase family protein [Verrucomicrobiota bacterium]
MASAPNELLTDLLREVSRSFYLTLRVLPKSVRPQIGLAYLLARTTDTIADTEIVPLELRLKSLQSLRERILGTSAAALSFGELARQQKLSAERILLERCEDSLALLQTLSAADRRLVREVIEVIASGQELDLRRFAGSSLDKIIALQTADELDDYTYRVAGCVGEFWTKMCRAQVFPSAQIEDAKFLADGVRFGKGLQLVNILRDLPADLKNGRCYLPLEDLKQLGLTPADLQNPANENRLRPLFDRWLDRAEAHLRAGWDYTNTVPWSCVRVRLACAWPVLIGLQTLGRLRSANVLDATQRIKISRAAVRGVMFRSVIFYPLRGRWKRLAS